MEQQTVNQIQTGEGLAVVRVENAKSQRWEELREKYNPVETYTVKSEDYIDFYYSYDPKRLTVHTSFRVAEGVAVFGENGRVAGTGTIGYELISHTAHFEEVPDWIKAHFNELIESVADEEYKTISDELLEKFSTGKEDGFTDISNSMRLKDMYGDKIRYAPAFGWLVWNGKHWEKGSPKTNGSTKVRDIAQRVARNILLEAHKIQNNTDLQQKYAKWSHISQNSGRLDAMLKEAKTDGISVSDSVFDEHHPLLVNMQNGEFNLETGKLAPHEPKKYSTRITRTNYVPNAKCPKFETFMEKILPNKEIRDFVQRAVGYSITGHSDEKAWFYCYDVTHRGNNGKSTLFRIVGDVLGDVQDNGYFTTTDVSVFVAKRDGGITAFTPDLHNARLVVTNEVDKDFRINANVVKRLTGNDPIKCNQKYLPAFEFKPTHSLWSFGNQVPKPVNPDDAFYQRVYMIPFSVEIPEEDRRPMGEVLAEFQYEHSGIFNWMYEGYLAYRERGLDAPREVRQATEEYKDEFDYLNQFIEEECSTGEGEKVSKEILFYAYNTYLKQNGESPISKKAFTKQLQPLGISVGGHGNGYYINISYKKEDAVKEKIDAEKYVNQHFTPPIR